MKRNLAYILYRLFVAIFRLLTKPAIKLHTNKTFYNDNNDSDNDNDNDQPLPRVTTQETGSCACRYVHIQCRKCCILLK